MSDRETAPIEVGEERTLEVEDTGDEEDGVAYIEGFVVLVPDAQLGERVRVRVREVSDDFAVADVLEHESDVGS